MKASQVHTDLQRNLGLRIRFLREQQGLSQYVFSDMISMNRSYLISVEKGRRNISLSNLFKISSGLGITLSDMLTDVDGFVYEQVQLPEAPNDAV